MDRIILFALLGCVGLLVGTVNAIVDGPGIVGLIAFIAVLIGFPLFWRGILKS